MNKKTSKIRGFTLIELMVSISIFSIIMLVGMGSILQVFGINEKSQTLRAVMDNLNFTLEDMTRSIRFGSSYHCGSGDPAFPQDCLSGATMLTVKASDGSTIQYKRVVTGGIGTIVRLVGAGADEALTSPDVDITALTFFVLGATVVGDIYQPRVVMVVSGLAGKKNATKTAFTLETTVSQRMFDF